VVTAQPHKVWVASATVRGVSFGAMIVLSPDGEELTCNLIKPDMWTPPRVAAEVAISALHIMGKMKPLPRIDMVLSEVGYRVLAGETSTPEYVEIHRRFTSYAKRFPGVSLSIPGDTDIKYIARCVSAARVAAWSFIRARDGSVTDA